ncbi:MAG: mechanosensitive ion channel family protein [Magnetococcales bacterium]|nr:mechanosensitive ion channel family protein [Magnetococcales bacterium]
MPTKSKLFIVTIILVVTDLAALLFPDGYIDTALSQHSSLSTWLITLAYAFWWGGVGWVTVTGFELFLWQKIYGIHTEETPRPRKLLTDLFDILVYIAIVGVILVKVLQQPISTVFATSGVVAIIMGLALQNTLGDLFAGLALNIERPYKAGDWLTLEDKTQGLVILTNWRATHILLRTADLLVIPNSAIAKTRFINHALPHKSHWEAIEVPMQYGFDPDAMAVLLKDAVSSLPHVSTHPAPFALLAEMKDAVALWRVFLNLEEMSCVTLVRGQANVAIMKAIRQAGLEHLLPNRQIWLHQDNASNA